MEIFQPIIDILTPWFKNIWVQMSLLVIFATAHGYAGAWLAVRMLFRPRNPIKIFGITIFPQGMIPRHRERLANAIGKAVGDELMSQDTIIEQLTGNDFLQKKIDGLIRGYVDDLINKDLPPIADAVPSSAQNAVREAVALLRDRLSRHVRESIKSPESIASINSFVERRVDDFLSKRVDAVVDESAFDELASLIEKRIAAATRSPKIESNIREIVSSRLASLLTSDVPIGRMFTDDAVNLLKEKAAEQIDPAIHQLTELAAAERTREQIGALIKREVHEYYENLPFFKKIFVSRETLLSEVDDLVNESLPRRIEEMLKGDLFADEARRYINETIDKTLAKPMPTLIGTVADDQVEKLRDQIVRSSVNVLRDDETIANLREMVMNGVAQFRPHSIDAILQTLYPESEEKLKRLFATGLTDVLVRDETGQAVSEIIDRQIERVMQRPIGRITDLVSRERIDSVVSALSAAITSAIAAKLPAAVAEFDVGGIVREKIRHYPPEKLESLILSVAKEHLRTIELFGAGFGLAIGLVQAVQFWIYAK